MNLDEALKLIDVVAKLAGVLVWPALLLFLVVRFGDSLREFMGSLGELSFKGGGFEATAKRMAEAQAALVAAAFAGPKASKSPEAAAADVREAAEVVSASVNASAIRRASGARILWVDDHPSNNIYERQSLAALGASFVEARSTEEALRMLQAQKFDLIISDMSRPPDERAGYTLLDKLRQSGNGIPFIIYSGSNDPEHQAEARRHGAVAASSRASELFANVLSVLKNAS